MLLLLAIAGIMWLSHRFKMIVQMPVGSSMRSLSIPIPTVPLISVNKITHSTVFLHWDSYSDDEGKDVNPNSISHYILYVNGIQSNVINGRQQSCTIENLIPSKNYQIDLVTFNVSGYQSRSSPIFIKTSFKKVNSIKDEGLNYPDSIIKSLLDDDELKSIVRVDNFKSRSRSGSLTENTNGSGNNANNSSNSSNNKLVHVNLPHLTSDINELKWMLETALAEYNSLLIANNEASIEFNEEELNLSATRNEAKERRRYEDTSKASLRQEIKLLEEQKLKANTRLNKDEKKLEEKKLKIIKQNEDIAKWELKMNEMKESITRFKNEKPQLIEKYQREIEELNKMTFTNFSNFHEIENDLKTEISDRKQLEVTKKKLETLITQLPGCFNFNTGLYNADGIEIIESIIKLFPTWGEQLRDELIIKDQDIFNLWKKGEDELIRAAKGHSLPVQTSSLSVPTSSPPLSTTAIPSNSLGHVLNPTNSGSINSQSIFNVSPDLQFASIDHSHKRIPSNHSWGGSDVWSIPNLNVNDQNIINLLGDNLFSAPNQISSSPNLTNPLSGYDYSSPQQQQSQHQQQQAVAQPAPSITSITALSNNAKQLMHKTSNGSLGGLLLDGLQTSPLQMTTPQSAPQQPTDWTNTSTTNPFSYVDNGGRGRSGSNRTIWSNNNSILTNSGSLNGNNGGIHSLLNGSLQMTTEPYYPNGVNTEPQNASDDDHHSSSFSLKSKIFKFGMSPHKTLSNKTSVTNDEDIITDEDGTSNFHKHSKSTESSSTNGGSNSGGGFLASGLTTTSRFFKKHRLSTGTSFPDAPIEEDEEQLNSPVVETGNGLRKLSLFSKNEKRNM